MQTQTTENTMSTNVKIEKIGRRHYLHGGPDHTEEILALFNDAEILERVVHSGSKSMERA